MQQLTLLELAAVIKHFSLKEFQSKESVTNLYAEIEDFLGKLELLEDPDQEEISNNVDSILKEYHCLKDNIRVANEFYN